MLTLRRSLLACGTAVAVFLIHPSLAAADVACSFSWGTVDIDVAGSATEPQEIGVIRNGDSIEVYDGELPPGGGAPVDCGTTPTITNTDLVDIRETTDDVPFDLTISLAGGPFEPGLSLESSDASEIEFEVFGDGAHTFTLLGADDQDEFVRFGTVHGIKAANLNAAAEPTSPDGDDIRFLVGARDLFEVYTDGLAPTVGGDDVFSARGNTAEFNGSFPEQINAYGGPGNDDLSATLHGSFFNPPALLDGGPGNDRLVGGVYGAFAYAMGAGDDVAVGGGSQSDDIASYGDSPAGVSVDLSTAGPQDTGAAGTDTLNAIDAVHGSPYHDLLIGSEGGDRLYGEAPALTSAGGNDVLIGRGGADYLFGLGGTDTASYAVGSSDAVSVDLRRSGAQLTHGAGADALESIENLVGSPFGDVLTGNGEPNAITGLEGNDSITSFGGADTIDVRDGERDDVSCGDPTPGPPGDYVAADWRQLDIIAPDCEQVEYSFEFPPDTTAPETSLDGHPKKKTRKHRAKFSFSSPEGQTVFECKLDDQGFVPCDSPRQLKLGRGRHRFKVRAKDPAGNIDPTPAKFRFRVIG